MASMDPKTRLLKELPLFSRLGDRDLDRVAQLTDEVDVPAGRVLMRQGDRGDEMFIVAAGRLTVDRDGRRLSERGPGESVGEMALLSKGPRNATVTAAEPSRLLVLAHREFNSLLDAFPSIRLHMLEVLAERVRVLDADAPH